VDQPFAPLTQQYETCSNDPTTALFNQAGVSAGNVSLLSPLGVLLVLGLLAAYQFCSGASIPRSYSRGDKDAALDALAVAMLLVRDRRIGSLQKGGEAGDSAVTADTQKTDASEKAQQCEAARKAAVLGDLVEALSEVAAASQQDASLLHQRAQEPVYVDWGKLGAHVLGGTGAGRGSGRGWSRSSRDAGASAPRPGESSKPSQRETAVAVHKGEDRRADSDDEVELPTISRMHYTTDSSV
jgi:hypothetical protein